MDDSGKIDNANFPVKWSTRPTVIGQLHMTTFLPKPVRDILTHNFRLTSIKCLNDLKMPFSSLHYWQKHCSYDIWNVSFHAAT